AGERGRHGNDEALRAARGLERYDLADAVDVPRDDMPVERIAGLERRLEIDACADGETAERGHRQRLAGDIRGEAPGRDLDRRETHAVDRDAAAERERADRGIAELDDEALIAAEIRARGHAAATFHQPREHGRSPSPLTRPPP